MRYIIRLSKAIICIIILLFCVNSLKAQVEYTINTGIAFAENPKFFDDMWHTGLNVGAGVDIPFASGFILNLDFNYQYFPLDEQAFLDFAQPPDENYTLTNNSASSVTIMANTKAVFLNYRSMAPYVIAGFGLFSINSDGASVNIDGARFAWVSGISEIAFGANVGVGFDVSVSRRFSFFVTGQYMIGFTEIGTHRFIPIRAGLKIK